MKKYLTLLLFLALLLLPSPVFAQSTGTNTNCADLGISVALTPDPNTLAPNNVLDTYDPYSITVTFDNSSLRYDTGYLLNIYDETNSWNTSSQSSVQTFDEGASVTFVFPQPDLAGNSSEPQINDYHVYVYRYTTSIGANEPICYAGYYNVVNQAYEDADSFDPTQANGCGYFVQGQCTVNGITAANHFTCPTNSTYQCCTNNQVREACGLPDPPANSVVSCGNWLTDASQSCDCDNEETVGTSTCCGWHDGFSCLPNQPTNDDGTSGGTGGSGGSSVPTDGSAGFGGSQGTQYTSGNSNTVPLDNSAVVIPPTQINPDAPAPLDINTGPTTQNFQDLNPLLIGAGGSNPLATQLSTPGGIVSRILVFAFPIAGLILFVMLVWGGFEILVKAPTSNAISAGQQRITAAIVGFILLFCSYWLMQIVEYVFGIKVL